jgi:hypothetical protein
MTSCLVTDITLRWSYKQLKNTNFCRRPGGKSRFLFIPEFPPNPVAQAPLPAGLTPAALQAVQASRVKSRQVNGRILVKQDRS